MAMQGVFTLEERMMLCSGFFRAAAGTTDDQRKAYRAQEHASIRVMSDAALAGFKADLDSRWNALSGDQKAVLTANVQSLMAARRAGGRSE